VIGGWAHARDNRQDWKKVLAGNTRAVVDNRAYSAEDAFNLIINGDLFHMDEEKTREWACLSSSSVSRTSKILKIR
jgi:hypothetical protein